MAKKTKKAKDVEFILAEEAPKPLPKFNVKGAVYIGRRIVDGALYDAFIYNGEEVYFSKQRFRFIGSAYPVIEKGENFQMNRRAGSIDGFEVADNELVEQWRALSWAAESKHKAALAKQKLEKDPEILRELEHLKRATKNMSWGQKRAALEFILEKMGW